MYVGLLGCGAGVSGEVVCGAVTVVGRWGRSVVGVMTGGVPLLLWLVVVKGGIFGGAGCQDPPS